MKLRCPPQREECVKALVHALGGPAHLAATLGITRYWVNWWYTHPIPWRYYDPIMAMLISKELMHLKQGVSFRPKVYPEW